ncbi:hypothetical protein [Mucilaginibacter sp. OK283]|jgi:hypothetical protein|uniref:hypothetical protein n=1 Tax=Mucilaginibacter sp. OK283 TaxID=1881049 RepID=UPI0008B9D6CB|nr:hypothetical protein [Mucilaginibacter sp. OK283]SEP40575.1 hypothetical protein SAMN05428947_114175 [Mucilaginibacter sp. OK283]
MKKITLTATLVCVVMACLAAVSGLAGKWQGSVKLADGNTYPANYEFQISDGKLTGTATAEGPPKVITDTRINGNDFSFSIADDDGSAIKHSGKYYPQGDSVSLNVNYGGTILHTTLTRKKN